MIESDKGLGIWTAAYTKIYFANFLIFLSQYLLLPTLPAMLAQKLNVSVSSISYLYLLITGGMILAGPFYAYLVDVFKRKYVYVVSWLVLLIITFIYPLIGNTTELIMLAILHGVFFGIANMTSLTLSIDLTSSPNRNRSNVLFGWAARLGMITGVAMGAGFYFMEDYTYIKYLSILTGCIGILFVLTARIPFRAPIGLKLFSLDRFFLPRGLLPMINLILLAVVPGILFPLMHIDFHSILVSDILLPFFGTTVLGYVLSVYISSWLKIKDQPYLQVITGICLIIVSLVLLLISLNIYSQLPSSLILGIGLGMVTPRFLKIFIMLSSHCERGSANMTHLIAWETGISIGFFLACQDSYIQSLSSVFITAIIFISASLLCFIFITYPFYNRYKIRNS